MSRTYRQDTWEDFVPKNKIKKQNKKKWKKQYVKKYCPQDSIDESFAYKNSTSYLNKE